MSIIWGCSPSVVAPALWSATNVRTFSPKDSSIAPGVSSKSFCILLRAPAKTSSLSLVLCSLSVAVPVLAFRLRFFLWRFPSSSSLREFTATVLATMVRSMSLRHPR